MRGVLAVRDFLDTTRSIGNIRGGPSPLTQANRNALAGHLDTWLARRPRAYVEGEGSQPVVVPYTELTPDLLHAVVESYVLREGTDYGEMEFSLEDKVEHVISQLKRGEARIAFKPISETESMINT